MESFRYLLFYSIFLSFITKFSLASEDPIKITNETYIKNITNITQDLTLIIQIPPVNFTSLFYLHFSTSPLNNKSQDLQQIIYSSENEAPTTNNSDEYSFRYSRNANLIVVASNDTNQTYAKIRCFKYPCSFQFIVKLELESASLDLNENTNYYLYNSNSVGKEKINKLNVTFQNAQKKGTNFTIAVINPGDADGEFSKLYYYYENHRYEQKVHYNINRGVILFLEEGNYYEKYDLEIDSLENQFITISIKTSSKETKSNDTLIQSIITPNTIPKFSNLKVNGQKTTECYKLNEDYINNYINDDKTNILYASINYFSLPIKTYLNYSNNQKEIDNKKGQNSLNVILAKESNEYPQICFEQGDPEMINNTFMIEVSHIYQGMEYIDINNPLFSGYFITKTLYSNTLGVYSHYSDIHYISKISFYLKPLIGKPEMYLVQSDDYPNCYNSYKDLENKQNVVKATDFSKYQFVSKKYENKVKDLSPNGPSQNLLYVYCPDEGIYGYCQFQILIYSDIEEIILNKNEEFDILGEKYENLFFKYVIKKGDLLPKKVEFCINATKEDIYFNNRSESNNATINYTQDADINCYIYAPDKNYNIKKKDFEIVFDIIANRELNFFMKMTTSVIFYEIGEIVEMKEFSFPYQLNYLIDNSSSDLLFNFYLIGKKYTNIDLNKIEINVNVVNETYLEDMSNRGQIITLNDSLKGNIDIATQTAVLNINKEFIQKSITDNKTQYYLHVALINKIDININEKLDAKLFLLNKQNNQGYLIKENTFINDKLIIEKPNIFNLYHIKMESKTILEIKFSSNYPINDTFLVYFIDYRDEEIDIDYIEKNNIAFNNTSIGQMYTFSYENNKPNNTDVIMAVVSKLEKNESMLREINYIFKYKTFSNKEEYNKRIQYEFEENFNLTEKEDKHCFQFWPIKKNGNKIENAKYFIRKNNENKKIAYESFATYAKIQSEYELIHFDEIKNGDTIQITVPKMQNLNCSYSIIVEAPDDNEKFALSIKNENVSPPPESDDKGGNSGPDDKGDNSWIYKIMLPIIGGVVLVVVIIIIILCLRKKSGTEFKQSIMKTSFKEDGSLLEEKYVTGEEY